MSEIPRGQVTWQIGVYVLIVAKNTKDKQLNFEVVDVYWDEDRANDVRDELLKNPPPGFLAAQVVEKEIVGVNSATILDMIPPDV